MTQWHRDPYFWKPNGQTLDLVDLYAGGSLFLVLNGPSFDERQRILLTPRPGILTMGINNGAHLFRPDLWTCVDDPRRFMSSIWEDPRITKFVPQEHFGRVCASGRRVGDLAQCIGYRRNDHFRPDWWLWEPTINWGNSKERGGGRSVMLVALRLAWLLGFRRVYLVGCDFDMTGDRGYWFPEQRTNQAVNNNLNSYRIIQGYFAALRPHFNAAGFEVLNCNPASKLEAFDHTDLRDAIIREASRLDLDATTEGMYVPHPPLTPRRP